MNELTAVFCRQVDDLLEQHSKLQIIADGCRRTKRELDQQIMQITGQQSIIRSSLAQAMTQVPDDTCEARERVNLILGLLATAEGGI